MTKSSERFTETTVNSLDAGMRLDRWLRARLGVVPQALVQKWLRKGDVRVDGLKKTASDRLEAGQQVRYPTTVPAPKEEPYKPRIPKALPTITDDERQMLRSMVLHEDNDMFILNKPAGLAVQGGTGIKRSVDGWLHALAGEGEERPKLTHRLDQDTSGILVIARHAQSARWLTEAFRNRKMEKCYWAVVVGVPAVEQGIIDLALAKGENGMGRERMEVDEDGKHARTRYRTLDSLPKTAALMELWPETGRTHQLRVHMAAINCPILGDGKYGGKEAFLQGLPLADQLHLHARSIVIPRPGKSPLTIKAPLPPHMKDTLEELGLSAG